MLTEPKMRARTFGACVELRDPEPSPGAGHNPRVMAGAWARAGQGSSCWALCRCCGSAGLTPELSRAGERPRRWDDHSASAEAAKRSRLERIVSPQTCFCGVTQRRWPKPLVPVWNFHTQQPSPGAGHNPRVMAGALGESGAGKLLLGSLQMIFLCRANT